MSEILKSIQGLTAEGLLQEYGISFEPPINLNLLLERIGIVSIPMDFLEIERSSGIPIGAAHGLTFIDDEKVGIFYKEGDSENRCRFTIAHEIAHCCIHTSTLKNKHVELEKDTVRELAADIFAGELLIPYASLKPIYDRFLVPSLDALATIFQVSTHVMAARLDHLKMAYYKDTVISEV